MAITSSACPPTPTPPACRPSTWRSSSSTPTPPRRRPTSAAGLLKPDGAALTLQNGIGNLEILAATLGSGRVLGGVTMNSANLPGPGQAQHSHAGPTWLGELDGKPSPRLAAIVEALTRAGLETIVTDDVQAHVWNKFVLNCAINPLCAITGLLPGEIAVTPES